MEILVDNMEFIGKEKTKPALILYGTETGNAEDIAFKLGKIMNSTNISVNVHGFQHYDINNLPVEDIVIFIVSTTGDGEIPSNMQMFWKFLLRKAIAANVLQSLKFAIFGLGDSSYEKFNAAARLLFYQIKIYNMIQVILTIHLKLGNYIHVL